ncbi:coiled-coil-helix-coiled-coil-helix domain containing 3a isoform X2 [Kryptolebias marmoratus]|uniref:Coiled-coil-helix-coiled-coil-helix domain containing 3a n=1 Tax=Kryptolebias marmoratus TaxID=37003 RepID=A0A3Q3AWT4_KRYMA|nr:coiled-coil-helix-coiled-coil-helix domain containing 3a isoform X2 [Kryptolebias marmoratus]
MGANNSTRRVSFESDENDNVTVVKGIRLSENVIKRMKEPAAPPKPKQHSPTSAAPNLSPSPFLQSVPQPFDPLTSLPPPPAAPAATETVAAPSPRPPTEQPTVDPLSPAPVPEPVARPESSPVPPPAAAPAVDEEALRKKITDELEKSLEQDRAKAEREMQAWFEAEKARASAQAQAETQSQVQAEVSRMLSAERALTQESLQQAVLRERITIEDDRLRAQLLAKQLETREADLKKQDAFYRDQVARLEDRSAQFYKVTTENYNKAADQLNAKFKRYEVYPVCADLQGQILACYKGNVGKTLNCSNIAALYLQCVNNAKQNKLRTGG